jgi:hypothetical protein
MSVVEILVIAALLYGARFWVIPTIAAIVTIWRRLFSHNSGPDLLTYRQELEAVRDRWDSFCESHNGLIIAVGLVAFVVSMFYIGR